MGENGMGLSPESRELLKDTHIVFHGAATVRFDEKLREAVNINVRGTKEILMFSRELSNLKVSRSFDVRRDLFTVPTISHLLF